MWFHNILLTIFENKTCVNRWMWLISEHGIHSSGYFYDGNRIQDVHYLPYRILMLICPFKWRVSHMTFGQYHGETYLINLLFLSDDFQPHVHAPQATTTVMMAVTWRTGARSRWRQGCHQNMKRYKRMRPRHGGIGWRRWRTMTMTAVRRRMSMRCRPTATSPTRTHSPSGRWTRRTVWHMTSSSLHWSPPSSS